MSRHDGFDPLALMVMSHAVSMIAEEMGAVLERGALSPNIRERRDASSALFDARGRMVAQAAHIPVHLGAMPESVRAKVFEPFYTTKPAGSGTGLGLAVTHDVVEKSGGTITVESAGGEGTTFVIRLPLVQGA